MPDPTPLDRFTAGWRAYVLIALVALAAAIPGVFRAPPLDRDESRFAQATTQMLETGDFVRIAVQDSPRNKKPVGIHWMQVASVEAFSSAEARTIWAYRLPSVLGALIASLALFWGGSVLVGRRAALLGALLFASCVLMSTEAMIAKTDAALCGFTTLAMAALARLRSEEKKTTALIFWAAIGAGVLIKGPVTIMVAGLCLLALFAWERRANWMKPLTWWPGPILAALIVLPWAIAIGIATNGAFFTEAFGEDLGPKLAGGDEGHSGPPGYHLIFVWLLLFPASIALPAAVRIAWEAIRKGSSDTDSAPVRFLIAWAVPTWIAFEMLPTKLVHYTLPAYPALALLCGAGLIAAFERPWPWLRRTSAILLLLLGTSLIGLCAFLTTLMPGDDSADMRRAVQTLISGAVLLLPAAIVFLMAKRANLAVAIAVLSGVVFAYSARQRIMPEARQWFITAEASDALMRAGLHPRLSPDAGRLMSIGLREPSFVFLTRTDTMLRNGDDGGRDVSVGQAVLLEDRQKQLFAETLATRGLTFQPVGPAVEGFNYSNGDAVRLQPGRVISGGGTAPAPLPSVPPAQ